jgi:hypothetical protein
VEGEQQVEALLRPDLADNQSRRTHAQGLLHQLAQPDLAGALQTCLLVCMATQSGRENRSTNSRLDRHR